MKKEFNIEKFTKARKQMVAAEYFIIEEAAKMNITLTKEQACIFANAVLKAYEIKKD